MESHYSSRLERQKEVLQQSRGLGPSRSWNQGDASEKKQSLPEMFKKWGLTYNNVQPHIAPTPSPQRAFPEILLPCLPCNIWILEAMEKSDYMHRINHFLATLGKLLASLCLSFLLCKQGYLT